jgi:butyryl-CoA dehydrogenase
MLYNWVPEQQEVRDRVKAFCEEHVVPFSQQWDRRPPEFPEEIFQKMAKEGFVGFPSAKEYGGRGEPKIRYATLIEEMSKYDGAVGIVMAVAVLASYPIEKYGTEEQKRKYLPPMAKGTIKGACALTEPEAGSDAASQRTTALDKGDHYLLNGEKIFITSGNVADVIVVICRVLESEDQPLERGKVTALIFDNKNDPGYSAETIKFKMGIRASTTGRLYFKNVKIPKENLLGPLGKGFRVTMATLDSARIGVASQALGIAQHAFDESVAYAKKRVQFGKPIGDLQAIQWMVADMATRVDAARLLTYRAALLEDQGDVRFSREAAMAKLFASETACFCADCAMQIHAGYGYCGDYSDIEHIYRDARITRIYEGTSEVQRLVIGTSFLR